MKTKEEIIEIILPHQRGCNILFTEMYDLNCDVSAFVEKRCSVDISNVPRVDSLNILTDNLFTKFVDTPIEESVKKKVNGH